jgi:RNA polymerase sigma factor (sigma-70 family)
MKRSADGFTMLAKHEAVVWGVLAKAGVRQHSADYEDYLQDVRIWYVEYYMRYHDSIQTEAEIIKFNKLAFNALLRQLCRKRNQRYSQMLKDDCLDDLVIEGKEPVAPDSLEEGVELSTQLSRFALRLSPRELQVFTLKYQNYGSNRLIAEYIGVATSTVSAIHKRIQTKFSNDEGAEND